MQTKPFTIGRKEQALVIARASRYKKEKAIIRISKFLLLVVVLMYILEKGINPFEAVVITLLFALSPIIDWIVFSKKIKPIENITALINHKEVVLSYRFCLSNMDWNYFSNIQMDKDYIYFIYNDLVGGLTVPQSAFDTKEEFEKFYQTSLEYWQKATVNNFGS
jgi:hypothetical protein